VTKDGHGCSERAADGLQQRYVRKYLDMADASPVLTSGGARVEKKI